MTTKVIMVSGVPGSGKSTYVAREAKVLEEDGFIVATISRDSYRKQLVGETNDPDIYFSREKEVFENFINDIQSCLESGIDYIFIDATHINPASRAKVLKKLRPAASTALDVVVIRPSLDECLRRNAKRVGFERVPDEAIKKLYRDYVYPNSKEFKDFGFGKVTIIIPRSDI